MLWIGTAAGEHRTVAGNGAPNVSHLDTLVSTADALYVVDICANGFLWQTEPCGVIYKLTST